MIFGLTSTLPCVDQVAEHLLEQPEDTTKLTLIVCNQSPADVILADRMNALAAQHSRFKVVFLVDKTNDLPWSGDTGYVTKELLAKHMPAPSADCLIMTCGPPPMEKSVWGAKFWNKEKKAMEQGEVGGLLKEMGYTSDSVFKF